MAMRREKRWPASSQRRKATQMNSAETNRVHSQAAARTMSHHFASTRAPERAARTAPRAYQARNTTLTAIAATSGAPTETARMQEMSVRTDRKSTRLNSSHVSISYAVFCLKKKKIKNADDSRSAGDHR